MLDISVEDQFVWFYKKVGVYEMFGDFVKEFKIQYTRMHGVASIKEFAEGI